MSLYLFLSRPALLAFICMHIVAVLAQQRTCYWADGSTVASTAPNQFLPCSEVADSQCCRIGDACLSNGLCFGAKEGMIYRAGCTDKDWKTGACGKYCQKYNTKGWANFWACPWTQARGWVSWCGQYVDNPGNICTKDQAPNGEFFNYPAGTVQTILTPSSPPYPTQTATEKKADFHWRFYTDRSCDHYSNPKDTFPANGTPAGDGIVSNCYSAPSGSAYTRVEVDNRFPNSQRWGVQTFCQPNCKGTASIKQQDNECYLPTEGCTVGSFRVMYD